MKRLVIIFSVLAINYSAIAQTDDNIPTSISSIHAQYGVHAPAADMKNRFGINQFAGIAFSHKTASNFMFDIDFSYFFGGKVKIHDSLFSKIANKDGYLIDASGMHAEVYTYERGYFVSVNAYKILPIFSANENSGLTLGLGAGFMQHKIRIYNPDNNVPQISGDYLKGYDYLSNGPILRQYIGYTFFAPRRVYSFRAGFEVIEGFTQCRRDYLFPVGGPDTKKRLDVLYGIKLNWTIPLKKNNQTYYYN